VNRKCAICKKEAHPSIMIRDEHYKDVWFHLDCLNTEKGIRWRADKAKEDSLYARYLDLISFGKKIKCPTCGEECEIYPKSSHRPEIWETVHVVESTQSQRNPAVVCVIKIYQIRIFISPNVDSLYMNTSPVLTRWSLRIVVYRLLLWSRRHTR